MQMDYFLPEILRVAPVHDKLCAKEEPAIGTVLYSHRLSTPPPWWAPTNGKMQSLKQGAQQYTLLRCEGYVDDGDGFRLLLAQLRETPWMRIREQNPRVLLQIYVPHSGGVDLDELAGVHFPPTPKQEEVPAAPPARGLLQSVPLAGWEGFVAVATHARPSYTAPERCKSSTLVAVVDFLRDPRAEVRLQRVLSGEGGNKLRSLRVVTTEMAHLKQLEKYQYGLQVITLSAKAEEIAKLLSRKVNRNNSWCQETPGPDLRRGTSGYWDTRMPEATVWRGTDILVCGNDRKLWRLCDRDTDDDKDTTMKASSRSAWPRVFGANHGTRHSTETWSVTGSETLLRSLMKYTTGGATTVTPSPWNPSCNEQKHHPNKRRRV